MQVFRIARSRRGRAAPELATKNHEPNEGIGLEGKPML
jgi:hypothetical protein